MERFELNGFAGLQQQVHHQFQIFFSVNVAGHDIKVGSVQKDLTEQLWRQDKDKEEEKK